MPTMKHNGIISCVVCAMTKNPKCVIAGTTGEYQTSEKIEDRDVLVNRISSASCER